LLGIALGIVGSEALEAEPNAQASIHVFSDHHLPASARCASSLLGDLQELVMVSDHVILANDAVVLLTENLVQLHSSTSDENALWLPWRNGKELVVHGQVLLA
jgi:hypothetical protein